MYEIYSAISWTDEIYTNIFPNMRSFRNRETKKTMYL